MNDNNKNKNEKDKRRKKNEWLEGQKKSLLLTR
jgi:hypothetical protein